MNEQAVGLMDVLAPPGNHWLMAISRSKNNLPPGVHIVRFSDGGDDPIEDDECANTKPRRRKKPAD